MIQAYLAREAGKLEARFLEGIDTGEQWQRARPRFMEEYFDMLGLSPMPEKTPLHATLTGTLDRGDYVVDMIHYQSSPGLYVTGNLYRPASAAPGGRLPAIFYVCGHAGRGRDGNKTAYQSHGIWFARHGYICLIVDTLQLGEIPGIHHGTYREDRWWWVSRGYNPAGAECWNGIRGIDYLASRGDVDPKRIGVTGISGGGAVTFWIAAADERVQAAVPVSGTADLIAAIPHRFLNEHCDCIFLYNTYQWPWARIASLIAPRPQILTNSNADIYCPMDSNERESNRLERVYALLGAGDRFDTVVSVGAHAYREDLRQAIYRFMNIWLKNDPGPVTDSEIDLVSGSGNQRLDPIPPSQLRVFPEDTDLPADAVNGRIDETFVPMARTSPPDAGSFAQWKDALMDALKERTFPHFPARIPAGTVAREAGGILELDTEPGITVRLREDTAGGDGRVVLWVTAGNVNDDAPNWLADLLTPGDTLFVCEPRGIGGTRWTHKDPPNYIERAHFLLGRTADSGRVWDIAAAARYLRARHGERPVHAAGEGASAVLAASAGLLEPGIGGLLLQAPPETFMNDDAPVLLNVLRICDVPEILGLFVPKPLTLMGASDDFRARIDALYHAANPPL